MFLKEWHFCMWWQWSLSSDCSLIETLFAIPFPSANLDKCAVHSNKTPRLHILHIPADQHFSLCTNAHHILLHHFLVLCLYESSQLTCLCNSSNFKYYGKPFGAAYESQAFFFVLDPLVLLTTVWLWIYCILWEQESRARKRATLSEWDCLSRWHWCQKVLGTHPSWDKWSFGLWECGVVPSFDVSALKDLRWRQEGLSRVWHLHEL